jgi:hypothetical protein
MASSKLLLHVGCANRYCEGFVNSDMRTEWKGKPHKLDLVMDMTEPWPYDDESVDGIVGMHVFQQLDWRGPVAGLHLFRCLYWGRAENIAARFR